MGSSPASSERAAASVPIYRYWPRRFSVVGLCFLSTFICYLDRVNMSVAIIPMAEEFGWSQTTRGVVLSSFFYGYLTTQILGGWLADRFGAKTVLGLGVVWWSLFTLVTPPAAAVSLAVLFVARVMMGAGEGVNFPAIISMFARWVPSGEKSRAAALNYTGIPLGTVCALLFTPMIISAWGWQAVFYVFGSLGFLWWVVWAIRIHSTPDTHPSISESERQLIRASAVAAPPDQISWRKLLSRAPVWALIYNHFCNNWGFYVILTWLPTYFTEELGVELDQVGVYTLMPWLVMFVVGNCAGWLADHLINRGFGVTLVRKLMQTIGFLGPSIFLFQIGGVETAAEALTLMVLALGLGSFAMGGFLVNHLDLGPRYAGTLLGFSNTAGTLPGILGVTLTGYILDATGSWGLVFGVAAGIYLSGLLVWLIFATGERIFD